MRPPPPEVVVTDPGDNLAAGPGCVQTGPATVRCAGVASIRAMLGDLPAVWGGPDNDRLCGGGGDDDWLFGQDGTAIADTLNAGSGTNTCTSDPADVRIGC
ncbi:hypothetical protein [Nonomuraea sp. NPDC049480]|uniref:hypothetical protein n=1 Tax=Nonomuraea sp. NPDC049480 TaxID=3364353 RepID=UPI0037B1ABE2